MEKLEKVRVEQLCLSNTFGKLLEVSSFIMEGNKCYIGRKTIKNQNGLLMDKLTDRGTLKYIGRWKD